MENVILLGEARTKAVLLPFVKALLSCGFPSPAAVGHAAGREKPGVYDEIGELWGVKC